MKKTITTLITIISILTVVSSVNAQWDGYGREVYRIYKPFRVIERLPDFRIGRILMKEVCNPKNPSYWFLQVYVEVNNYGGNKGLDDYSEVCVYMDTVPIEYSTFSNASCSHAPRSGESYWFDLTIGAPYVNWLPSAERYTLSRSIIEFHVDQYDSYDESNENNNITLFNPSERDESLTCSY